jgi:hypothetical protein
VSHRHHDAVWDNAPHLPLEDRLFLIGDPNEVGGRRPCSKGQRPDRLGWLWTWPRRRASSVSAAVLTGRAAAWSG